MHEYDIALKSILMRRTGSLLTRITGLTVAGWHNVEFPEVRNQRADLMGETAEGSSCMWNCKALTTATWRSGCWSIRRRRTGRSDAFPTRLFFMLARLESPYPGDNIVAVLARLGSGIDSVRRILKKIAQNEPGERARATSELMILAGLRQLGSTIEREMESMPILDGIMDHEVFGRERRRGERNIILTLMAERFGPVPAWAKERVEAQSGGAANSES